MSEQHITATRQPPARSTHTHISACNTHTSACKPEATSQRESGREWEEGEEEGEGERERDRERGGGGRVQVSFSQLHDTLVKAMQVLNLLVLLVQKSTHTGTKVRILTRELAVCTVLGGVGACVGELRGYWRHSVYYSIYSLYSYKSTNTDADTCVGKRWGYWLRAQFTCFTSTQVQILTQKALQGVVSRPLCSCTWRCRRIPHFYAYADVC